MANMVKPIVFELEAIPEPGGCSFRFETSQGEQEGFVIRLAGEVRAYINSCPHTGVTLNWSDEQFFDIDHKFIHCSLHGALFEPLNGRCIRGPCAGDSLQAIPLKLVDRQVLIYI